MNTHATARSVFSASRLLLGAHPMQPACFVALALLAFVFAPFGRGDTRQPTSNPQLFVLAALSDSVTVIDATTNQVSARIPVGKKPIRIAMTPDGRKAYVSNSGATSISVIDTVNWIVIATVDTGHPGPQELTITPDGSYVFVVHQNAGYVTVIETATDTLVTDIAVNGTNCRDIIATPDNLFVYVANYYGGEVSIIDRASYAVKNVLTAEGSRRLGISPNADRIYASNYLGNTLSVIDTASQSLIKNIAIGQNPRGVAVTPNGREIYVSNVTDDTVSVIDNALLEVVATIPVEHTPWHVAMTSSGRFAYVSNSESKSVSIIDRATHSVVKTLIVGKGPFFSVVHPNGDKLYVSNSRDTTISVIDLASQTVVQTIADVGSQPFDLAFDAAPVDPAIIMQPVDASVNAGEKAKFRVVVTGTKPVRFQWKKDGIDIPGATKVSYITPPTTPADSGSVFVVKVSNRVGSVTSDNAILTVR